MRTKKYRKRQRRKYRYSANSEVSKKQSHNSYVKYKDRVMNRQKERLKMIKQQ